MKKIIYISFAALLMGACDSFLTKDPIAKLEADTYFKNETSLEIYSNGFIEKMLPSEATLAYGSEFSDIIVTKISTDYYTAQWSPSRQTGWDYSNWFNLFNINYFLQRMYEVSGVDQATLLHYEGTARFWRAWFYFEKIRTFGAVPWYDEPIDAEDYENLHKPRDSREYVMSKVLEDLNFAVENCLTDSKYLNNTKINKWVALAYKSRVCLFEGTYRTYHTVNPATGGAWEADEAQLYLRECAKACEQLMESGPYSLVSDLSSVTTQYRSLFTSQKVQTQEVIWAREYDDETGIKHQLTTLFNSSTAGQNWSLNKSFVNMYLMLDGSRFTDINGYETMEFYDETQNRDYRLQQTVIAPGYTRPSGGVNVPYAPNFSYTLTGYQIIKWVVDSQAGSIGFNDNSLPILRYAEVLLNYAEAKAELGEFSEEVWNKTIRLLRQRSGVSGNMPQTADPYLQDYYLGRINDAVLLEIRRERSVELVMEHNIRVNDLYRWKMGELFTVDWNGIYIPQTGVAYDLNRDGTNDVCVVQSEAGNESGVFYLKLSDGTYSLTDGDSGLLVYRVDRNWDDKMYLRPIPKTALDMNPALGQNYYWQ